jgi:predicted dehydrogenase
MAAKIVKWGVIGSGGIARRRTIPEGIVPAENAALAVVYDINARVNHEVANEFGATAVESLGDLLAADIDAVYVASPVNLHLEHVKACAGAGKNVLCEKPLGISVTEAEEMLRLCEEAGVMLGTALMMRFVEQHKEALRLVETGALGIPVYARAQLSCWYPPLEHSWRQDPATSGGGSLMDMGSHCIDLLEMFFGEIVWVSCFTNRQVHDYQSEDSAVAMLYFKNGALATVDNLFNVPDNSVRNVLEIYGSKGSILAQFTIGQGPAGDMKATLEQGATGYDARQERAEGVVLDISPTPANTYEAEIMEFSNALIEGRRPLNSAGIGLRNQKVLAACYESARTRRAIQID